MRRRIIKFISWSCLIIALGFDQPAELSLKVRALEDELRNFEARVAADPETLNPIVQTVLQGHSSVTSLLRDSQAEFLPQNNKIRIFWHLKAFRDSLYQYSLSVANADVAESSMPVIKTVSQTYLGLLGRLYLIYAKAAHRQGAYVAAFDFDDLSVLNMKFKRDVGISLLYGNGHNRVATPFSGHYLDEETIEVRLSEFDKQMIEFFSMAHDEKAENDFQEKMKSGDLRSVLKDNYLGRAVQLTDPRAYARLLKFSNVREALLNRASLNRMLKNPPTQTSIPFTKNEFLTLRPGKSRGLLDSRAYLEQENQDGYEFFLELGPKIVDSFRGKWIGDSAFFLKLIKEKVCPAVEKCNQHFHPVAPPAETKESKKIDSESDAFYEAAVAALPAPPVKPTPAPSATPGLVSDFDIVGITDPITKNKWDITIDAYLVLAQKQSFEDKNLIWAQTAALPNDEVISPEALADRLLRQHFKRYADFVAQTASNYFKTATTYQEPDEAKVQKIVLDELETQRASWNESVRPNLLRALSVLSDPHTLAARRMARLAERTQQMVKIAQMGMDAARFMRATEKWTEAQWRTTPLNSVKGFTVPSVDRLIDLQLLYATLMSSPANAELNRRLRDNPKAQAATDRVFDRTLEILKSKSSDSTAAEDRILLLDIDETREALARAASQAAAEVLKEFPPVNYGKVLNLGVPAKQGLYFSPGLDAKEQEKLILARLKTTKVDKTPFIHLDASTPVVDQTRIPMKKSLIPVVLSAPPTKKAFSLGPVLDAKDQPTLKLSKIQADTGPKKTTPIGAVPDRWIPKSGIPALVMLSPPSFTLINTPRTPAADLIRLALSLINLADADRRPLRHNHEFLKDPVTALIYSNIRVGSIVTSNEAKYGDPLLGQTWANDDERPRYETSLTASEKSYSLNSGLVKTLNGNSWVVPELAPQRMAIMHMAGTVDPQAQYRIASQAVLKAIDGSSGKLEKFATADFIHYQKDRSFHDLFVASSSLRRVLTGGADTPLGKLDAQMAKDIRTTPEKIADGMEWAFGILGWVCLGAFALTLLLSFIGVTAVGILGSILTYFGTAKGLVAIFIAYFATSTVYSFNSTVLNLPRQLEYQREIAMMEALDRRSNAAPLITPDHLATLQGELNQAYVGFGVKLTIAAVMGGFQGKILMKYLGSGLSGDLLSLGVKLEQRGIFPPKGSYFEVNFKQVASTEGYGSAIKAKINQAIDYTKKMLPKYQPTTITQVTNALTDKLVTTLPEDLGVVKNQAEKWSQYCSTRVEKGSLKYAEVMKNPELNRFWGFMRSLRAAWATRQWAVINEQSLKLDSLVQSYLEDTVRRSQGLIEKIAQSGGDRTVFVKMIIDNPRDLIALKEVARGPTFWSKLTTSDARFTVPNDLRDIADLFKTFERVNRDMLPLSASVDAVAAKPEVVKIGKNTFQRINQSFHDTQKTMPMSRAEQIDDYYTKAFLRDIHDLQVGMTSRDVQRFKLELDQKMTSLGLPLDTSVNYQASLRVFGKLRGMYFAETKIDLLGLEFFEDAAGINAYFRKNLILSPDFEASLLKLDRP